jgi:ABC-2 type transport system permease protein
MHGLRSYGLLVRWNLLRLRSTLPLLVALQILLGAGIVVGFSFLVPQVDEVTARYLSAGALTLGLVTVGMIAAPQHVVEQKHAGIFDYQRAMPVPRLAMLAADASVWVALALPGLAAALGVAALRFDLDLRVSPMVVPAVLLVAVCAVALGYSLAYATAPQVAAPVIQFVFFITFMFAPINFPAQRLPGWLAAIHAWLPFTYMAQAIRETVFVPVTGVPAMPFAVLVLWSAAGIAITYRVMTRRG